MIDLWVKLRELNTTDASSIYVGWLNDPDVNKYLEPSDNPHTLDTITNYIKVNKRSKHNYLYGIFVEDIHVGNIKIGDVNKNHDTAEIGYLIGNKDYWGKGIASEAIRQIIKLSIHKYGLAKISAGVYEGNIASERVLRKCGFSQEGRRKSHVQIDGKRRDYILYGSVLKEYLQ
jgi:[ribosomal protein S5]-alanine N-acetyltransferase